MILYHWNQTQDLKVITKEVSGTDNIYASNEESYASAFPFTWLAPDMTNESRIYNWRLLVPQRYQYLLQLECSLYKVRTISFKKDMDISIMPIWVSSSYAKVIEEYKFKSYEECLKYHGLSVILL